MVENVETINADVLQDGRANDARLGNNLLGPRNYLIQMYIERHSCNNPEANLNCHENIDL